MPKADSEYAYIPALIAGVAVGCAIIISCAIALLAVVLYARHKRQHILCRKGTSSLIVNHHNPSGGAVRMVWEATTVDSRGPPSGEQAERVMMESKPPTATAPMPDGMVHDVTLGLYAGGLATPEKEYAYDASKV